MKQFNNCVIAKKHGRLSILIANKCNINHDKLKCSVPLCSTKMKSLLSAKTGDFFNISNEKA